MSEKAIASGHFFRYRCNVYVVNSPPLNALRLKWGLPDLSPLLQPTKTDRANPLVPRVLLFQARLISGMPSRLMLTAAFQSRSRTNPHSQEKVRSERGNVSFMWPQSEHVLDEGNHMSILTSDLPRATANRNSSPPLPEEGDFFRGTVKFTFGHAIKITRAVHFIVDGIGLRKCFRLSGSGIF